MHPALRKGPLFYKKTPPILHFFTKNTPHFPLFTKITAIFHFFTKKTLPSILFPAYGPENAVCMFAVLHSESSSVSTMRHSFSSSFLFWDYDAQGTEMM